jgi:NAD(P)-dependent dehydrogenase (short-subunit alcohol dehydrogenase family)
MPSISTSVAGERKKHRLEALTMPIKFHPNEALTKAFRSLLGCFIFSVGLWFFNLVPNTAVWILLWAAMALWQRFVARGGTFPLNKDSLDLSDKVVIVTGANTGIGFETAKALAGLGAKVILACRDMQKAARAVDLIQASLPQKARRDSVLTMKLDLSDPSSIRKFASEFQAQHGGRLDLLINNAGLMTEKFRKMPQGIEEQVAVNALGTLLLTELLFPLLVATADAGRRDVRIVTLASNAHQMMSADPLTVLKSMADTNPVDFGAYKKDTIPQVYGSTKLADIWMTLILAERCRSYGSQGSSIQSVAVHPGAVTTELGRDLGPAWLTSALKPILLLFSKTASEGAMPTLYCALSPEVVAHSRKGNSGGYYYDCALHDVERSPASRDPVQARHFYHWALGKVGLPQEWAMSRKV